MLQCIILYVGVQVQLNTLAHTYSHTHSNTPNHTHTVPGNHRWARYWSWPPRGHSSAPQSRMGASEGACSSANRWHSQRWNWWGELPPHRSRQWRPEVTPWIHSWPNLNEMRRKFVGLQWTTAAKEAKTYSFPHACCTPNTGSHLGQTDLPLPTTSESILNYFSICTV